MGGQRGWHPWGFDAAASHAHRQQIWLRLFREARWEKIMARGLMIFREAGLASRMHWIGLALGLALVAGPSIAGAQERVTFPSLDADLTGGRPTTVNGYLYKPEGPGPFPAVVGLHGCGGLMDTEGKIQALYGAWGAILSKEGYIV